jgi:hypothetical protein
VAHIDPMTLQAALPANAALIPADALRAGTRLNHDEIDCVVARSAVAMVYRAQDRTANRAVASKEFLPTGLAMRGDDGQVVAREAFQEQNFQHGRQLFLDEMKAPAKCEQACLLPVRRVMECHGTVYKVMPYRPGPALLEHRQDMPTTPTDRLLRNWFEGLLGALAELHERGMVHAAVSPGKILLLPDGRPLLLDSDAVYAAIPSDRTRGMIAALEPGIALDAGAASRRCGACPGEQASAYSPGRNFIRRQDERACRDAGCPCGSARPAATHASRAQSAAQDGCGQGTRPAAERSEGASR